MLHLLYEQKLKELSLMVYDYSRILQMIPLQQSITTSFTGIFKSFLIFVESLLIIYIELASRLALSDIQKVKLLDITILIEAGVLSAASTDILVIYFV